MHRKTKTMSSTINQKINNNRNTALERTATYATGWEGGGGGGALNAFYWRQIFALDSVVIKTQNCLAPLLFTFNQVFFP